MKKQTILIDYEKVNLITAGTRPTSFSDINRLNWRCQLLLTQHQEAIKGKKVLDLASNNGKFSYACLELGAKSVTGVEGRQQVVERAEHLMSSTQFLPTQWSFIQGDIFEYLATVTENSFDTILCFGFLYHTVRQVEFFKELQRIKPAHVILDTAIWKNYFSFSRRGVEKTPSLMFIVEDPTLERMTIDKGGLVAFPTKSFLEYMFKLHHFTYQEIPFRGVGITNWTGLEDYKKGNRVGYIANLIR